MPTIDDSICAYCKMTGFKDWQAYQEHLAEELSYRRSIPKYTVEEKKATINKVEKQMKDYLYLPEDTIQRHLDECRCESCVHVMLDTVLNRLTINFK